MFINTFRKFALGSAALLAIATLGSAQPGSNGGTLGSSGAGMGSDSDATTPTTKGCPHTGAKWVDPKVSSQGAAVCVGTEFKIDIGVKGIGGTVTITSQGCPAFLIIAPGHDEKVQNLHTRAVNPQDVPWQKQKYKCIEGVFWDTCVPNGGPQPQKQKDTDWEQEACDVK